MFTYCKCTAVRIVSEANKRDRLSSLYILGCLLAISKKSHYRRRKLLHLRTTCTGARPSATRFIFRRMTHFLRSVIWSRSMNSAHHGGDFLPRAAEPRSSAERRPGTVPSPELPGQYCLEMRIRLLCQAVGCRSMSWKIIYDFRKNVAWASWITMVRFSINAAYIRVFRLYSSYLRFLEHIYVRRVLYLVYQH